MSNEPLSRVVLADIDVSTERLYAFLIRLWAAQFCALLLLAIPLSVLWLAFKILGGE